MFFLSKNLKNFQPIAYYNDKVIVINGNKLFISDVLFKDFILLSKIPLSPFLFFCTYIPLLSRLFRLHVRCSLITKSNFLFLNFNKVIYYLDLSLNQPKIRYLDCPHSPLYFTDVSESSDYHVIFGDYLNNPERKKVPIIGVKKFDLSYEIIISFPDGSINHIHNIIPSHDKNFFFVLCGDFEHSSSIHKFNLNENTLVQIVCGEQIFRACWGYHSGDFLYYCTDSQFEQNYFVRLNLTSKDVEILSKINGSVIYGTNNEVGNKFFSTTVEPDFHSNFLLDHFSNNIGPGINSNFAVIYMIDGLDVFPIIHIENDYLPLKLFGFATFMFPSGEFIDNDCLIAYSKSVYNYDSTSLLFRK